MYRKLIVGLSRHLVIVSVLAPVQVQAKPPGLIAVSVIDVPQVYIEVWRKSDTATLDEWQIYSTRCSLSNFARDWWRYYNHPEDMDPGFETGWYISVYGSVIAAGGAAGICAYPGVATASAGAAATFPYPWPFAVIGSYAARVNNIGAGTWPAIMVEPGGRPNAVIVAEYHCWAWWATGQATIIWNGWATIDKQGRILAIWGRRGGGP